MPAARYGKLPLDADLPEEASPQSFVDRCLCIVGSGAVLLSSLMLLYHAVPRSADAEQGPRAHAHAVHSSARGPVHAHPPPPEVSLLMSRIPPSPQIPPWPSELSASPPPPVPAPKQHSKLHSPPPPVPSPMRHPKLHVAPPPPPHLGRSRAQHHGRRRRHLRRCRRPRRPRCRQTSNRRRRH